MKLTASFRSWLTVAIFVQNIFCSIISLASPLGNTFTYQGQLDSNGVPADGYHDFEFSMFDAASGGVQVGSTQCVENLAVTGGKFVARLDFGPVFNGNERWLEIRVRADSSRSIPCSTAAGFILLSPRQSIDASPHSLFAIEANAAGTAANLAGLPPSHYLDSGNFTGTLPPAVLAASALPTLNSANAFTSAGASSFAGSLGIGVTAPTARLEVNGVTKTTGFQMTASPGAGYVLTSDSLGRGTWQPGTSYSAGAGLTLSGGVFSIANGGVTLDKLSTDVRNALGSLTPWTSAALVGTANIGPGTLPFAIAFRNNFVFVANLGAHNIYIFDVTTPTAPAFVSVIPTSSGLTSIAVNGTRLYAMNYQTNLLQVFDVASPPTTPLLGSAITDASPSGVVVAGSFAYVTNQAGNTLQIFNVSNPAAISMTSRTTTAANPSAIALTGTSAVVTAITANLLQVFDVSNPAAPVLSGSVATGSRPQSVAISGSTACVINSASNSLQLFNISTPANPLLVSTAPTAVNPEAVAVSGGLAFVVTNTNTTSGLQAFDIRTPSNPILLNSLGTGINTFGVGVNGAYVYVTNYGSGNMQIFRGTSQFPPGVVVLSGPVGIGTSDPTALLSVNGTANKPGGGSWATFSDARLKRDTVPLTQALERLLRLRGVEFEYIAPEAIHERPGRHIGMIAQEVEREFPEWVSDTNMGYKSVAFTGFEALAVEAMRELDHQQHEQSDRIGMLLGQLELLRRENELLRNRIDRLENAATPPTKH